MKNRAIGVHSIMVAALGAGADEVSDWNQNMFTAVFTARTSPLFTTRVTALMQAAVFDALNGVYNRYTPVRVAPATPNGASARAAVIQAGYASLLNLYPAQQATLDAQRAASLANLKDEPGGPLGQSVQRGLAWGQYVAEQIWAWRSVDGITPNLPPFLGGTNIGQWRPTPPALASGAGPQFAYMTTWVIPSQEPFRPPGPPALDTARFAADVNETQRMGRSDSGARTADQTLFSIFWNGNTAGFWNRTALQMAERYDLSLLEEARVLALMNLAEADAVLCCWEAKYTHVFWRPITAIALADFDGNAATTGDPTWTPLLITPNHPEYPSGHSTASGASAAVLAAFFGDDNDFGVTSELTPRRDALLPQFFQRGAGDSRCARLRRHSLPHGLHRWTIHRAAGGRLRFGELAPTPSRQRAVGTMMEPRIAQRGCHRKPT